MTDTSTDPIPGVVELTTIPVTAEGLKTTEDNWDDMVAFTTVTITDGEDEIQTVYVRKMTYMVDAETTTTQYELYDGKRMLWTQFVISDWILKTGENVYEAMDENMLRGIYDVPV